MKTRIITVFDLVLLAVLALVDFFLWQSGVLGDRQTSVALAVTVFFLQLVPVAACTVLILLAILPKYSGIENGVRGISEGGQDLTRRIKVERNPLVRDFARSINVFIAKIHNLIMKIKTVNDTSRITSQKLGMNTSELSSATAQIAANIQSMKGNEELLHANIQATGTSIADIRVAIKNVSREIGAQTGAMASSSSAIEEMIASISNIGAIAGSKQQVIDNLSRRAAESVSHMDGNLAIINRIAESADSINEFTQMINAIAVQTNILSMNAAIEAAHAGDFGKGFGVVADEIRKLAEDTASNAVSISSKLHETILNIHEAQSLTGEANKSVQSMTGSITEVAESVSEIVQGLTEMTVGSRQITESLAELNTITASVSNSAALIESASDAIETSMADIDNFSNMNTGAIGEISAGINDLVRSVSGIHELGEENLENIRNLERDLSGFRTIDVSKLTSEDGQPLIIWNDAGKTIPARPGKPESLPETDPRHWYDYEYAGWNVTDRDVPLSNADGAHGKRVVSINPAYHPYFLAHNRGMKKIAEYFGIDLVCYPLAKENNDQVQRTQIEQAIREKPDMIIFAANDVKESITLIKKVHSAGIPIIATTTMPAAETFPFLVGYTGTDEWGAFRQLARKLADKLGKSGGYACIQHVPGSGPFIARTWAAVTELEQYAPSMRLLDKAYTEFDRVKTREKVALWIRQYGDGLKGIFCADQTAALQGVVDAVEAAGRRDIVIVSQGHCRISLDFVKEGKVYATTYQSAETDGALPVAMALDYFNGIEFAPVTYLPNKLITRENVDRFYPPQW